MPNNKKPISPDDREMKKIEIEAYEKTQSGWQRIADKIVDALKEGFLRNKKIESHNFIAILVVIFLVFVSISLLTWQKVLPAEGLYFFSGTIVGYLISLTRPIGK